MHSPAKTLDVGVNALILILERACLLQNSDDRLMKITKSTKEESSDLSYIDAQIKIAPNVHIVHLSTSQLENGLESISIFNKNSLPIWRNRNRKYYFI